MTLKQLRETFWDTHPRLDYLARLHKTRSKGQNEQTTDCRCAFVEFVDYMQKAGHLTERQADNATL
jgi:hypothetical protein